MPTLRGKWEGYEVKYFLFMGARDYTKSNGGGSRPVWGRRRREKDLARTLY